MNASLASLVGLVAIEWLILKASVMSRPIKWIVGVVGFVIALWSLAQAIEYFYLKTQEYGSGVRNGASAWWSHSPWTATLSLSLAVAIIAGTAFGLWFWSWASARQPDASKKPDAAVLEKSADAKSFEEQLRQIGAVNRPVITLTPAKFTKDDAFLRIRVDGEDPRGILIDHQLGVKNVGKIPTRVISLVPAINTTNSTTGKTSAVPLNSATDGFALAPDQEVFAKMSIRLEWATASEAKHNMERFLANEADAFTIAYTVRYSGIADQTSKYATNATFRARKDSVAIVLVEYL